APADGAAAGASLLVGGAAARDVQSQAAREPTPATRASALTPPRPPVPAADDEDPDDEPAPPRHPVRHALLLLTLVGLLGGGLWYGWNATQSSYYVGATESGRVAVFQGLPGRVAGIELSRVYATSEVSVSDLTELAQDRVLGGDIRRNSAEEARQTMAELIREHLKPLCPAPRIPAVTASAAPSSPTPSPSVSATPDATTPTPGQASATPSADASGTPSPAPPTPYDPADCRTE